MAQPVLTGDALAAVNYRGGNLQIIASAGSGKTEVVSQRVAALLKDGEAPDTIVAFTFTERAATSLKARIQRRVVEVPELGQIALDRLNGMFVGTIHAYCFRLLQEHVPRYQAFDVLDEHRLTAFLTREAYAIGIVPNIGDRLFKAVARFGKQLNVIENELLEADQLNDPLRSVYLGYLQTLEEHRFLTYGQQVARAVEALKGSAVSETVAGRLRHLIVDEYQDVNPAQEGLIALLAARGATLCVVGDDDQSIYQWRGSDVSNIITFAERYAPVKRFEIEVNRRSRPDIVELANGFAASIQGRLAKKPMGASRSPSGKTEVTCWTASTEPDQASVLADSILRLRDEFGYSLRDAAILCRGRVSFEAILKGLAAKGIPVQPGGRTLLFSQPEADLFGRTMCWLVGYDWRVSNFGWVVEKVDLDDLVARYGDLYKLAAAARRGLRRVLEDWKGSVSSGAPANLVRDFYLLLEAAGVRSWDLTDPAMVSRLGTLARCSQVLVDYEATRRRVRPKNDGSGRIKGAQDRGEKYFEWLAKYIQNWARGAYTDFEGEEDVDVDAVELTTIHQSKGLEWPVVIVPSLTDQRFPSSMTGRAGDWMVPTTAFDKRRYEGSENDERRLFYVAVTRARDLLSLSAFDFLERRQAPSPFLREVAKDGLAAVNELPEPPSPDPDVGSEDGLTITYSDLAAFRECGLSYRYRRLLGFQPPIVPELGYGKAVHHLMREVADFVRSQGRTPSVAEIEEAVEREFYLPTVTPAAYGPMRDQAKRLVDEYVQKWPADLHNTWAVERPFELHLEDAVVSGRADVIIDEGPNHAPSLAIVDYKTATSAHVPYDFQLQIYADAGRREGLNVAAAYVHDLSAGSRQPVDVGPEAIAAAESEVTRLVAAIGRREFSANPGPACARCDVRPLCPDRV